MSELYHHGILGQKWGKKNGPPYPLGSRDHSKAEKKAGWRRSLGGGRNEHLYDRASVNKDAKKGNKWATSKQQPSSIKARIAAGVYAATGSKRVGRALDRWNARDAVRYKAAKKEYKKLSKDPESVKRNERNKKLLKYAGYGLLAVGLGTAGYLAYKKLGKKALKTYELSKDIELQTLTLDPDRINKGKMYYASFLKSDKTNYTAFFGKDPRTKELKYRVIQGVKSSAKIANANEGFDAFKKLYRSDDHFAASVNKNIITNGGVMDSARGFVNRKLKIKGLSDVKVDKLGKNSEEIYENINKMAREKVSTNQKLNDKELRKIYTKFNMNIVMDENEITKTKGGNHIKRGGSYAKDTFFKTLKDAGFSGVIDSNDASRITNAPTIVFDKDAFYVKDIKKVTQKEINSSWGKMSANVGKIHMENKILPGISVTSIGAGSFLLKNKKGDKKK